MSSRCMVCGKPLTKSTSIGPVCIKKKLTIPEVAKDKINYSHITNLITRLENVVFIFNSKKNSDEEKNLIQKFLLNMKNKEQEISHQPDKTLAYETALKIAELADDVLLKLPLEFKLYNEQVYSIVSGFYNLIGQNKCGEQIRLQVEKDRKDFRKKNKYQIWR